jgi:RNA polymerase sigma-70 factor (ECF subfamily)
METINKEIIELAKGGDERSMTDLFNAYKDYVMRSAFIMLRSRDEAEDVTENVFYKVFTNLHSFDMERDFHPWLSRIIRNECFTYLKRNRRQVTNTETFLDTISSEDSHPETIHLVQSILDQLSQKEREIIQLRFYQELTFEEMAKVLSTSVGNVKVRIHRAIKKLKEMMPNDA